MSPFDALRGEYHLLFNAGGIGEVRFLRTGQSGQAELPVAVAFGGIGQRSSVGGKVRRGFSCSGMCNLFGCIILY